MSTTFQLSGPRFDRKSWDQQLQALLRGGVGWVPLKCFQLLHPEASTEPLKENALRLLGKGSTRGVLVESKGNDVSLDLAFLASEVDWDVARWLLVAGQKLGAELSQDGDNLSPEELKTEAFRARCQKVLQTELGMARGILAKDGGDKLRFPVAHFELSLSKQELELDLNGAMDSLVKQCFRYGSAHVASPLQVQAPDGTRYTVAHYAGVATLVPEEAQRMMLGGPEGDYTDKPVPMDKVREILTQFITPTGKFLFFPPIPWQKQPALLEALTGKSMEQLLESLDLQLSQSLALLPVFTFVLVAYADGEADQKEAQAFFDYIQKVAAIQNDQTIFASVCRRLQQEMKEAIASVKGLNHAAEFQLAIRRIDHRLEPETATAFKRRLYELAEIVAKASGGILGLGSKIDDREHKTLSWMHRVLLAPEKS